MAYLLILYHFHLGNTDGDVIVAATHYRIVAEVIGISSMLKHLGQMLVAHHVGQAVTTQQIDITVLDFLRHVYQVNV